MTASRQYWFHIEQVLTEIGAWLADARARSHHQSTYPVEPSLTPSALVGQAWRQAPDRAVTRTDLAGVVTAPPSHGAPVLPERRPAAEPLFGRPLSPAEVAAEPQTRPAVDTAWVEAEGPAELVGLRARIRERLSWLRGRLADGLSARETYHVLFALVIHVDEMTGLALGPASRDYRPLQQELFEIDDGGERFFAVLDELFRKEETLPLVYEVFYFCLKDGFVGRYGGRPSKLEEYRQELERRIERGLPTPAAAGEERLEVQLVEFPRHYYLYALIAAVVVFLVLYLAGALDGSL